MKPSQFAEKLRAIAKAINYEARLAEAQTVIQTREMFVKDSSGTLKTSKLRMLGHPYATRNPTSGNPEIINDQGGGFRKGWRKSGPRARGGGLVSTVVNVDPAAKYMLGTRRMIARPIDEAVAAKMGARRLQLHRLGIDRALRA